MTGTVSCARGLSIKEMSEPFDFKAQKWDADSLARLHTFLQEQAEPEYAAFNAKLMPGVENILGIRMPILRKYAKQIAAGNADAFLKTESRYFETDLLKAFVIGHIPETETAEAAFFDFLPRITNWAVCDSFCAAFKVVRKEPAHWLSVIQGLLRSTEEFHKRVALILLLGHFVKPEYEKEIISACTALHNEPYYVAMAAAWLLSHFYAVCGKQAVGTLLKDGLLDADIHRKTIQKIAESSRVSKEEKEQVKSWKREKNAWK